MGGGGYAGAAGAPPVSGYSGTYAAAGASKPGGGSSLGGGPSLGGSTATGGGGGGYQYASGASSASTSGDGVPSTAPIPQYARPVHARYMSLTCGTFPSNSNLRLRSSLPMGAPHFVLCH